MAPDLVSNVFNDRSRRGPASSQGTNSRSVMSRRTNAVFGQHTHHVQVPLPLIEIKKDEEMSIGKPQNGFEEQQGNEMDYVADQTSIAAVSSTQISRTIKVDPGISNDPKLMQTVQIIIEDCMTTQSSSMPSHAFPPSETTDQPREEGEMVQSETMHHPLQRTLAINQRSRVHNDPKIMQNIQIIIEDCMRTRITRPLSDTARISQSTNPPLGDTEMIENDSSQRDLTQEMSENGPHSISYQCYRCKKALLDEPDCRKHLSLMCLESFICRVCDKNFRFQLDLSRHLESHTGEEKSSVCSPPKAGNRKEFVVKSKLIEHKASYKITKWHACIHPNCGKKFLSRRQLMQHSRVDSGDT